MPKKLIVMRHGKAVSPSPEQDDFERELSEAGKRALAATLPHSLSLLEGTADGVQILSSPAPRAMQTASLLEKALKGAGFKVANGIEECTELWYQDIGGFLDCVDCCTSETVFAVGHSPFAEELVEQLTGAKMPLATGSLTAIALDMPTSCGMSAQGSYANRLLWFSQGPMSQRWKTLVQLEKTLKQAAGNVEERRKAFFDDPDDIETMHKFRVSIRTLRSLIAFVKPWQDRKQNAETQVLLREIVGYTSKLRELDVFAEQAKEGQSSSDELVAFCEQEAALERAHVTEALQSKRLEKKLSRALSLTRKVKWKKELDSTGLSQAEVRSRFDEMVSSLEAELVDLKLSEVERTHDVRKRAKRARYAAENFKGILGDDAVDIAKGMTSHQDSLGAVCDARVNIALINEFLERELPERVAWELTLLRAQNETFLYSALREDADGEQQE